MLLQKTFSELATETPRPKARPFPGEYHVQQFRFLPDSYFRAVGSELDNGTDRLVYLRLFVEEETEDEF